MGTVFTMFAPDAIVTDDKMPAPLSEDDAWAIAMTWQPQLQGKVRLVVDRDGPVCTIRESYAWVRLDEPRALSVDQDEPSRRTEVVSIARAVMLSWAGLAACPGFSGSENPAFWKRVISTLQEPVRDQYGYVASRDRPEQVTDANGFFDLPGHVFPRFMVDLPLVFDEASDGFFAPALAPAVNTTLQSLLDRLGLYTRARSPLPIDIGLSMPKLFVDPAEKYDLFKLGRAVKKASRGRRFRICQIQVRSRVVISSETRLNAMLQFLHEAPVALDHIDLVPRVANVSPTNRAKLLQSLLRLDGTSVGATVTSFRFSRKYMDDATYQALMAALPFATSTHSLAFGMESVRREELFEKVDLPWLAYAIFHPRAASSSWRHLELDVLPLTPHSAYVLTAMARGNNLLALLNGTRPDCDAYHTATVVSGTVVQLAPSPSSEVLVEVLLEGMEVDLCGISSLDRVTWGEWVAVVAPAYGLGYVRASELQNEQAHASAPPSLTGLRLQGKRKTGIDSHSAPMVNLLHLLPSLGASLSYLNIALDETVEVRTLREILRLCPQLRVLVASHAGELWSEPLEKGIVPYATPLEELELVVPSNRWWLATPTRDCIAASLRTVQALRIRVDTRRSGQLFANRAVLEQLLTHASLLRFVHWQIPSRVTPFATVPLDQLKLSNAKYLHAQLPLSPACAIAFLSVVTRAHQRGASALGELMDRGVLTIIFQFATTPMRRAIHLEELDDTTVVTSCY